MGHEFDLIWLVVNASAVDSTFWIGGKQRVALDQKPFERTENGGLRVDGTRVFKFYHAGWIVFSLAEILHGIFGYYRTHLRVLVGEMEKATRDFYSERLIAIEGEKPNAGSSGVVMDVSAEIEFMKPRKPWQGRKSDGTDALHEKGDDPQPGFSIKGIDMQALR